jgi:hypothetical protein
MKILHHQPQATGIGKSAMPGRGHTLVEMVTTMGVFSLVVLGMISAQIFGLRQDQLVISKLGASDQSRVGFDKLVLDIRSAKLWNIGDGSASAFTPIPNGSAQQGTALQLSFTTDTNNFVRYYFDTTKCQLCRVRSGVTTKKVIAQYLTNSMYFKAERYDGTVQTDINYKGVINVMLQFYQYQYPVTKVGPKYYYDFYKLEFRVTPHLPDGP